jgi:hypothetical protein
MRVYVAGKLEEKDLIKEIEDTLQAMGHEITCDWAKRETAKDEGCRTNEETIVLAEEKLLGILTCGILVLICMNGQPYEGPQVEFGIGLGTGKKIYVVGNTLEPSIFMTIPSLVKLDNLVDLYHEAKKWRRSDRWEEDEEISLGL